MTEKELRRLGRTELLQMLLEVSEENQALQCQVDELKRQLESRRIAIQNAGSIAEASLAVNGVFEAAQAAAQQYLDNLQQLNEQQDLLAQKREEEAKKKADAIIAEADTYWEKVNSKEHNLVREQDCMDNSSSLDERNT